jgi:GT2 family glycosyltransferase
VTPGSPPGWPAPRTAAPGRGGTYRRPVTSAAPAPDDGVPAGGVPFGGVQVVVVDAEGPPPALSAVGPDGRRRAGAWLVVRVAGAPVGLLEVSFAGRDGVPPAEVGARVGELVAGAAPRRRVHVPDGDLPTLGVVVASDLRRPEQLRSCLTALAAADYPRPDVVLVDNSRDPSLAGLAGRIAADHPVVRVVREPVPGLSAARNAGLAAVRGEVVAFTDDDVQVDPGWLRALGTRFALRPDEDAVTGLILPAELETDAQLWFERHYGGFGGIRTFTPLTYRGAPPGSPVSRRARVTVEDEDGRPVRSFAVYGAGVAGAGANMAFRTAALRRAGGFDLALGAGTPARGGEDLAAVIGLLWNGGSVGFEPSAVVFHTHRADQAALRDQVGGYGLGFTATLSALVATDPRHLAGLASQLPAAARAVLSRRRAPAPAVPPEPPLGPPPPEELGRLSRRGALRGPVAYLRSRRAARRRAAG